VRIIGGVHKGRVLRVPGGLPVRPTTDFAKEGLFNMLSNRVDLDGAKVLDLFSGTGALSLEFASRGATVTAVDNNFKCIGFLRQEATKLDLPVNTLKSDVFAFLSSASGAYHLVFADPPFDLPNISEIHEKVMRNKLVADGGMLIIEHGPRTDLSMLEGFVEKRKYGNVSFSFFRICSKSAMIP
jgi:16S rRNA (guanine966-N2)-methyltransferase